MHAGVLSGEVDQSELVAGCQALCSGDETAKLRLAFSCFDKDGDGHLTSAKLKVLLKGTIEPGLRPLTFGDLRHHSIAGPSTNMYRTMSTRSVHVNTSTNRCW